MQIWSWSGFFDYLLNPFLLEGAVTTLWLTAASLSAGLVLGIGLALMRLSGNPVLSGIAAFYCYPLLKAIIGCIPSFKVGGNGAKKESHLFA